MKLFHHFLKGSTLATALFIFQACYGTSHDFSIGISEFSFDVRNADDSSSVEGANIFTRVYRSEYLDWQKVGTTDHNGLANVHAHYHSDSPAPEFRIEGPDGSHIPVDTVIRFKTGRRVPTIEIKLHKEQ